jgi:hypothetical protein
MAANTLISEKNFCKQITFVIVAMNASLIAFMASMNANPAIAVTLNAGNQSTQDFNGLSANGTNLDKSTLPEGWDFLGIGNNASSTYSAGDGSSNIGGIYSFGANNSFDRSLGSLTSTDLTSAIFGVNFTIANATDPIESVTITYQAEQWWTGSRTAVDKLAFQYSIDATTLSNGTWTSFTPLDFTSLITTGATNTSVQDAAILTATISGLNLNNNDNFSIRWVDTNVSGVGSNDDALAVNNVSVTANPAPEPITMFGSLTALVVGAGLKKFRNRSKSLLNRAIPQATD